MFRATCSPIDDDLALSRARCETSLLEFRRFSVVLPSEHLGKHDGHLLRGKRARGDD